ncbi:ABC transporter ATP-binding protein [Actinomycetes bacterium]|jgi:peptide/nickel transport system ATP-binding protein|nr:ABC transporter ATP-binding protein [Actinomycetes bacterium]
MAGTGKAHLRDASKSVLRVEDLVVEFALSKKTIVKAVSGISLDLIEGETLSVVGESGCGKSTLGKAILQLIPTTSGSVVFGGSDLTKLDKDAVRNLRPKMQMIFQDPISSLDPRFTVKQLVAEPLEIWSRGSSDERAFKVDDLLNSVGIDPTIAGDRKAYEFSGGQCQRISIARSLALEPTLLICDEPVSALDVSIQAQILNLLQDMKERYGLTMMFISHDLSVVKAISTRILVMYLGKVCEIATPDSLYDSPKHHYTHALVGSVPIPDPTKKVNQVLLEGEPPSTVDPPSGCRFRTRCPAATELCATEEPQLREMGGGNFVACHHPRA